MTDRVQTNIEITQKPMKHTGERVATILLPLIVSILVLVTIEFICRVWNIPEYILPRPSQVVQELGARPEVYLRHTAITTLEAAVGLILATILAFACGTWFVYSRIAERAIYPYTVALKAVPIVALAPILIIWFGPGMLGKIVMSAMVCFFPIVVGATAGLRSPTRESIDLFRSLGATERQTFLHLRLPSAMPQLFSALKVSATLSVVGAIVGELTGALYGLGFIIINASYEVDSVRMFAGIVCASFVGIFFFLTVDGLEKKILFWHESIEEEQGGTVIETSGKDNTSERVAL